MVRHLQMQLMLTPGNSHNKLYFKGNWGAPRPSLLRLSEVYQRQGTLSWGGTSSVHGLQNCLLSVKRFANMLRTITTYYTVPTNMDRNLHKCFMFLSVGYAHGKYFAQPSTCVRLHKAQLVLLHGRLDLKWGGGIQCYWRVTDGVSWCQTLS